MSTSMRAYNEISARCGADPFSPDAGHAFFHDTLPHLPVEVHQAIIKELYYWNGEPDHLEAIS